MIGDTKIVLHYDMIGFIIINLFSVKEMWYYTILFYFFHLQLKRLKITVAFLISLLLKEKKPENRGKSTIRPL